MTYPNLLRCLVSACVVGLLLASGSEVRAETHIERFEGEETSWRLDYDAHAVTINTHRRALHQNVASGRYEQIIAHGRGTGSSLQIEHAIPAARVIDELTASLWFRSNHSGATLFLRVVFPHQEDPRTGKPLVATIQGTTYENVGRWQKLSCRTTTKKVRELIWLQRAALRPNTLDHRNMHVDRVLLTAPTRRGQLAYGLDDLTLEGLAPVKNRGPVVPAGGGDSPHSDVEFVLDQLLVDGRPVFPRIIPHHDEAPRVLADAGTNIVWIPDYRNGDLVSALRAAGQHVMAEPPRVITSGQVLTSEEASLVPFGRETDDILLWYMGTRIPPDAKDAVLSWVRQVRAADRRLHRPLAGDITGLERVFTRYVDMAGISRHTINTSFKPGRYRDWLLQKRKLARLGSFMWTWIQTEASAYNATWRKAAGRTPIVVEPEQIRMQVYAALAAGYRGIGYWKSTPLSDDSPGARERLLAITQLNLELELLEPWIASGVRQDPVKFTIRQSAPRRVGQLGLSARSSPAAKRERKDLLRSYASRRRRNARTSEELEAAVLKSKHGLLVLPVWYESDSQFVPGQLVARDATIVVPPPDETATAWVVTTTGVRSLPRDQQVRTTGGLKLTLEKFDQTAAIVVSSDRQLAAALARKVEAIKAKSARVCVELAEAKLARVRDVNAELEELGVGQSDAPQLLSVAQNLADSARRSLERGGFHEARLAAADCMQSLRVLQRAHWDRAVESLATPTTSVHTVSFQTLPDHWRMIARIGRARTKIGENRLASGDFESFEAVSERWLHRQQQVEGVRSTAELYPVGRDAGHCLRLVAMPVAGKEAPRVIGASPVSVVSPPITVRAGQIIHMSGRISVPVRVRGNLDGVTVYDTLAGPSAALRWHEAQSWKRFELIREVPSDREFRIKIALNGLGEVRIDDLKVVAFDPRSRDASPVNRPEPTPEDASPSRALDFLPRLPKLAPLPNLNRPTPRR